MKWITLTLFLMACGGATTTGPDGSGGPDARIMSDAETTCDLSEFEPSTTTDCNPASTSGCESCHYYPSRDGWYCAERGAEKQLGEACNAPNDCAPGLACHECECRTLCYVNDPAACGASTCDYWFLDMWGTCFP